METEIIRIMENSMHNKQISIINILHLNQAQNLYLYIRILLFKIPSSTCDCTASPDTRNKGINFPTCPFPDLWPSSLIVDLNRPKNWIEKLSNQLAKCVQKFWYQTLPSGWQGFQIAEE